MVDAETPPDFVLDTTSTGVFSDAIKSLTNSLGIPSVATSYGGVGELRYQLLFKQNESISKVSKDV